MHRILVFGMTENPGGVESFLLNYYRNINKEKIQFDFLCNSYNEVAYEQELLNMGARTFHIIARSKNRMLYKRQLKEIFKTHSSEWSAIWVNVSSLANIDYLKEAKKYGINRRIIHSHNSRNMDNVIRGILHIYNKKVIHKYATDFWACSEEAASWFYSRRVIGKTVIIHNAIDVGNMRFDERKREEIRRHYGWSNKYIIGNVGRLHFQKNQTFILEIFRIFHLHNPQSLLVLVGKGEDESKLKSMTKEFGLEGSVVFAGVQTDIQGWLSCFDLFLFPSRFEGLSIAALEAEANGVPVLASDGVIPREVKINDNFVFFDLNDEAEKWSLCIEKMKEKERKEYADIKDSFAERGYDIETEARKLERMLAG